MGNYKFGRGSENNLIGVHPDIILIMRESLAASAIDFGIDSGVRTYKEQRELFKKGRDFIRGKWVIVDPAAVVTGCDGQKKISNHQVKADGLGYAVDIRPYVKKIGGYTFDRATLCYLGGHVLAVANFLLKEKKITAPIIWGGNWNGDGCILYDQKLVDMPHFERALK